MTFRFVMRHVVSARAVENVAYVVCVNQSGMLAGFHFQGGSCAIDPLGEACLRLGEMGVRDGGHRA